MKRSIPVHWNFQPKPVSQEMVRLKNGQKIAKGVVHELRPEGYPRTRRIYCYGCRQYFPTWHMVLWRHGRCQEKPNGREENE
jgi:hypothetical protein